MQHAISTFNYALALYLIIMLSLVLALQTHQIFAALQSLSLCKYKVATRPFTWAIQILDYRYR